MKYNYWESLTSDNVERMEEITPKDKGINRSILGTRQFNHWLTVLEYKLTTAWIHPVGMIMVFP